MYGRDSVGQPLITGSPAARQTGSPAGLSRFNGVGSSSAET